MKRKVQRTTIVNSIAEECALALLRAARNQDFVRKELIHHRSLSSDDYMSFRSPEIDNKIEQLKTIIDSELSLADKFHEFAKGQA